MRLLYAMHTRKDGAEPGRNTRLDAGPVQNRTCLADGTLAIPAYISRSGVLMYSYEDGTRGGEYRDPSSLFSDYTLKSFRGVAITIAHPPGMVNTSNRKDLAVGFVGFDTRKDGIFLAATLYITDETTIGRILDGEFSELSCGYSCGIELQGGVDPESGESYDCVQTAIYGNHVALVDVARAGSDVKIYI